MKYFLNICFVFFLSSCQTESAHKDWHLNDGYVPDKETATKISLAVSEAIYGDVIKNEMPFKISLIMNVWIIDGTLPTSSLGGTLHIELQKSDGKILRVIHGK